MALLEISQGDSPVILAFPHAGTDIPASIWERLDENGRLLADTDWHLDRLYAGLLPGATMVKANFHRYVIDANRDPAGVSLYPGQNTTGLVPETDFDGLSIWREGCLPTADDIAERLVGFHAPYHAALSAEVERVRALHGVAILYDCHSIRSEIPFLFDGKLPDFNIGTDGSRTCAPQVETSVLAVAMKAAGYTAVLNGRFKGGWTTRHYGDPGRGVHAIQMELAQSSYLESEKTPFAFSPAKAKSLRPHLEELLAQISAFAPHLSRQIR